MVCRKTVDNYRLCFSSDYSRGMRWDEIFSGLDSLWDAEEANAEWDERREIIRAERAQQSFASVLVGHARAGSCVLSVAGLEHPIHVLVVGAGWVEGTVCGTERKILALVGQVVWASRVTICECRPLLPRVFEHLTFTAKLRTLERSGALISATFPAGGFRGRLSAVWKDAFELRTSTRNVSLLISAVNFILIDGA